MAYWGSNPGNSDNNAGIRACLEFCWDGELKKEGQWLEQAPRNVRALSYVSLCLLCTHTWTILPLSVSLVYAHMDYPTYLCCAHTCAIL